jgi:hypothetical protein
MISVMEYIKKSLETHLFFARIMKEHAFFLQTSFTQRDKEFQNAAEILRAEFDTLLAEAVSMSSGVVGNEVLNSGEVVTPYTLNAETATSFLTGVRIRTDITTAELGLLNRMEATADTVLQQKVFTLNQKAIGLITRLMQFKSTVIANVKACKMYTHNYPHMVEHILDEARHYLDMIRKLQSGDEAGVKDQAYEEEAFWNNIMAEHAEFIRGMLDPTEKALFEKADDFAHEFQSLTDEVKEAAGNNAPIGQITSESLNATREIRDFKAQGTAGILQCQIKSVIIPLLADHVLREANHYLRMLTIFE